MSSETFERLRVPIALGLALLLLAGYMILRRVEPESGSASPTATIVVGVPGGGVVTAPPTATASLSAAPSPTPVVTASPAPTPTLAPTPPAEEFVAEVLACRSISGAECNDEIERLRPQDETFVALVLFDNAIAGDVINVILDGPSGPVEGGTYALPGGGRGYYYSTFAISGLPSGRYTLTALRNGEEVARTELRRNGGDDDGD
ncbi:hypothetical protein BH20CHL8_BH20CHL8_01760 [soil metagenome]